MSYQKFVTIFAGKMSVLLLTAGFFTLTSMVPDRANFSGEWKLNESKSELVDSFLFAYSGEIV